MRSSEDILGKLSAHLADDLEAVDELIRRVLRSRVGLTNEVVDYLRATSGKRLRPMVALLASGVGGQRVDARILAAAVVELLHIASLLHDDVIDHASLRRGRATVNARWSNDVAILMADFLYSRAFSAAFEMLPPDMIAVLCDVAAVMCDGEMFQIEKNGQLLSEEDYGFIIECKTAELFSACGRLGGAISGAGEAAVDALTRYGRAFGCAFQIVDDVLDLTADPSLLGKDIGTDIACGKQTLPLIRALSKADAEDRQFLLEALTDGRNPTEVVACVSKYDGIEYAMEVARHHAVAARKAVEGLPDAVSRTYLCDLTEVVVNRRR